MSIWEEELARMYDEDHKRLCDYKSVDIQFREWQMELFRDLYVTHFIFEEDEKIESSEHGTDDDPVHDDWICDGECVRADEDQDDDSESSERYLRDDEEDYGVDGGEEQLKELVTDILEEDPYEEEYDKIAEYSNAFRTRKKKACHKRKIRKEK